MARLRTERERFADQFDCDLYNLIHKAQVKSEDRSLAKADRSAWFAVALALVDARQNVREMMHEQDRAETH